MVRGTHLEGEQRKSETDNGKKLLCRAVEALQEQVDPYKEQNHQGRPELQWLLKD